MGFLERDFLKLGKPPGFRVLNVGFRVLVGFQFSGSGRVRVAKWSGYSPGFRVFGFKDPSLLHTLSVSIFKANLQQKQTKKPRQNENTN